jgi:release factor glutamine methyltransferase
MTLLELAAAGRDRLVQAGISPVEAALDAEVLARHLLGWDRAGWLTNRQAPAAPDFAAAFVGLLTRRARREPLPFIVGRREFWGLDFEVTPAVLIPRHETELIVEEALAIAAPGGPSERVVDVGTGSGCLAVALAREWPRVRVVATDVSAPALAVARRNAVRHGVVDRIDFVRTSFLEGLAGPVGLIVSNPPNVQSGDARGLQPEVRDHEPAVALYGGRDGLASFRALLEQAGARLAPGGRFVVEFGLGQEDALRGLASAAGWTVERVREDLQGIARVAVLRP